jgi:hypothetical protein
LILYWKFLDELAASAGLPQRRAPLAEQARLVVAGCRAADLIPADLELVTRAHAKRFAAHA